MKLKSKLKSEEFEQWKRYLLDEINTEKCSEILRDNKILSDDIERFINESLIHWKNNDEWYLWFRFPKVIFLVGEKKKNLKN